MKNRNRFIMGTAIGLATVLTAIDHTKHKLPVAQVSEQSGQQSNIIIEGEEDSSPCSLGEESSPCGLGD